MTSVLPLRYDRLGYLRWIPAVEDQSAEWLDEEAAVCTAQEGLGYQGSLSPRNALVELLLHAVAASQALAVQLVEGVITLLLWPEFILEALDELQVKLGVQFREHCHRLERSRVVGSVATVIGGLR